ncbi:MAG: hypothetical protein HUJ96_02580 [Marinilabiliaceae bacterium]|nr:hypothetical protein [Marinilabiliaceae bacterium]
MQSVVWSSLVLFVLFWIVNFFSLLFYLSGERSSEPVKVRCEIVRIDVNECGRRQNNIRVDEIKDNQCLLCLRPVESVPIKWYFAEVPPVERFCIKMMNFSCFGLFLGEDEERKLMSYTRYWEGRGSNWTIPISMKVYEQSLKSKDLEEVLVVAQCDDRGKTIRYKALEFADESSIEL